MTGEEFRAIRRALNVTQEQMGRALGYNGKNPQVYVSKLELWPYPNSQKITLKIARLMRLYKMVGYVPENWK